MIFVSNSLRTSINISSRVKQLKRRSIIVYKSWAVLIMIVNHAAVLISIQMIVNGRNMQGNTVMIKHINYTQEFVIVICQRISIKLNVHSSQNSWNSLEPTKIQTKRPKKTTVNKICSPNSKKYKWIRTI